MNRSVVSSLLIKACLVALNVGGGGASDMLLQKGISLTHHPTFKKKSRRVERQPSIANKHSEQIERMKRRPEAKRACGRPKMSFQMMLSLLFSPSGILEMFDPAVS